MKKAEQFYLAKISEFVNWLQAQKPNAKVVWSTSTSYKEHKVPSEFRRYQRNTRILDINRKARDIWSDAGFESSTFSTLRSRVKPNRALRTVPTTIVW